MHQIKVSIDESSAIINPSIRNYITKHENVRIVYRLNKYVLPHIEIKIRATLQFCSCYLYALDNADTDVYIHMYYYLANGE